MNEETLEAQSPSGDVRDLAAAVSLARRDPASAGIFYATEKAMSEWNARFDTIAELLGKCDSERAGKDAPRNGFGFVAPSLTRRCQVCETRSMSDQPMPPEAWEIMSPALIIHLTEGSGYTFCGKNCAPWEKTTR